MTYHLLFYFKWWWWSQKEGAVRINDTLRSIIVVILFAILIFGPLIAIIVDIYQRRKRKWETRELEFKETIHELDEKVVDLTTRNVINEEHAKYYKKLYEEKDQELSAVQTAQEGELSRIELLRNKRLEIQDEIEKRSEELEKWKVATTEEFEKLLEYTQQKGDLIQQIKDSQNHLHDIQYQCRCLEDELDFLKASHVAAIKWSEDGNDDEKIGFQLTENDEKLVDLIKEIANNYPELKEELYKIAWSHTWLSKMQSVCKLALGDEKVSGIYRLVWKEDERVNYVGQATDIKVRWYNHAKKMVGAEPKGNEKLYADENIYRPDKFYWVVLEEIDGNDKVRLNEREEYWIEFFKCREIGLNKR